MGGEGQAGYDLGCWRRAARFLILIFLGIARADETHHVNESELSSYGPNLLSGHGEHNTVLLGMVGWNIQGLGGDKVSDTYFVLK